MRYLISINLNSIEIILYEQVGVLLFTINSGLVVHHHVWNWKIMTFLLSLKLLLVWN